MESFKELKVWQKSMLLAEQILHCSDELIKLKRYGFANQVERSALSIPSNIAEGYNRKSTKEYIQFLSIALGSLAELETQTILAIRMSYISEDKGYEALSSISEVGKMLRVLVQKLKAKHTEILEPLYPMP